MVELSQVKQKANTGNLTERIISFLHSLDYSSQEFKEYICLPLAQWLHDEEFSLEDTGLIITSVANVADDELKDIFNPDVVSLYDKADLVEFLSKEEFESLERLIKPPIKSNVISMPLDESTSVKVDFINKRVFYVTQVKNPKGEPIPVEKGVIEAVPSELIIYDSDFAETTRTFKITWKSNYSKRAFITQCENGATIKDIENQLLDGGYSHNKKLLSNVLSAMVNAMVRENLAVIKDTIDIKGVYYHDGKVQVVKLNTKKPSVDELQETVKVLEKLHDAYSDNELPVLATVLKWCLVSIFSFARKQAGSSWLPWLYLEGAGQSGKTTIAKIGSFFYGEPHDKMNVGGGSFNSEYRIGLTISRECGLSIVNEPKSTFNNEDTVEVVKNSVELKVCRRVQNKTYFAFSPVIFTANGFIPEFDSLYRRLFIISFTYNQRKSKEESDAFEKEFNVDNPSKSCLKHLEAFGRVALREIMSNPELLFEDWMSLADYFIEQCYKQADLTVPYWLKQWSKDKELEDLDNEIIESIQAIISKELYTASKRYNIHNSYNPDAKSSTSSKDFEPMVWDLIDNHRAFNWALPHQPWNGNKSLLLTRDFKKLLKDNGIEEAGSLESIAERLNWEYKQVRFGNSRKKGIFVPFDEFVEFAYPSVE